MRDAVLAIAVLALLAAGSVGCRTLGNPSPPVRYWVLEPVEGEPTNAPESKLVGIGPFEFPTYLGRTQLVSRHRRDGASQLRVSEFDRWGEPLSHNFAAVLAQNLERLVPGVETAVFPWSGPSALGLQVVGEVRGFEVVDGELARLEADWSLLALPGREVVGRGSVVREEPLDGSGAAASVAALSRALAAFSQEVAKPLASDPEGVVSEW